ncbi:MAG TPA: alkaline phosphatase family protein [Terriglobales bacterium]|nr:alkaline phosphatase family protein [Terriglobales bacterium]
MRLHSERSGRLFSAATCLLLLMTLISCKGLVQQPPPPPPPPASLESINHIIFLAQENRSFDHYFGALREYWAQNHIADQAFDGLPQFNVPAGAAPTNPGCDPTLPPPNDCKPDPANAITSYHLNTECIENPSPSWNESHNDWNLTNPVASSATLDGFVWTAAHDSRNQVPPFNDVDGVRVMGYYDGSDLNYYYFMASNFATSDAWFSPVMSRTDPNRMYLIAATSQGHVYPLNQNPAAPAPPLTAKTIFEQLQAAGVSWKIYVNSQGTNCSDTDSTCLMKFSSISNFAYAQTIKTSLPQNIASINQYLADAKNGTLPAVALIEPAGAAGFDEHPTVNDTAPTDIQTGAGYVASLINTLMGSQSWKDSVFILTFDEGGGLFDHVAPIPAASPDGIRPSDLLPGDICSVASGPNCDFVFTGYRVPLIVVSPFSKKNSVSHQKMDYTAILKLIETRFKVPALTKRDAAQPDMSTEFFDFVNQPWLTPPTPPTQNLGGACSLAPPAPG